MVINIITFKHGLFYYSCTQMKRDIFYDSLYYDNKKNLKIHARSFNKDRSMKNYIIKLKKHKGDVNNDNV